MFIGRTGELATLDNLYRSGRFELVILHGQQRVGKTALIRHFIAGKKVIYFQAFETSAKKNLECFIERIREYTDDALGKEFSTFQSAMEYVFDLASRERLILVIDEYPYVARASKNLLYTLPPLLRRYKGDSKLMLILSGSSISYMEKQVINEKSPFSEIKTAQIHLRPFTFLEVSHYYTRFSPEDSLLAYGLVGGIPKYLQQLDERLSIKENIKKTYLDADSFLYEEPIHFLKTEIREPSTYNAILTSIAAGAIHLTDIAKSIGEENAACATYLKNLISLGIVKKETIYGEKESRRATYSIGNAMFRFWYRFVPNNSSDISAGAADKVYRRIEFQMSDYMKDIFTDVCRQYLQQMLDAGKLPVSFVELGSWQDGDNQIDIVGADEQKNALCAQCIWSNGDVKRTVLDALVEESAHLPYSPKHFYVFSKRGFTKACTERAKELGNVTLVSVC